MNNHGNKFMDGLVLGAILGGAAVFLFGTKTGKNLLKIISEQGLDGLISQLQEYDLDEWEEGEEEFGEPAPAANGQAKPHAESAEEVSEEAPKRRFFKRRK